MKLAKKILTLFALVFLLGFVGCDIVEEPYLKDPHGNGNQGGHFEQKILLEKFTGHRCTNCPQATQVAKTLKTIFGDRLVVTSIHAGWFSNPIAPPFETNYQTPAGNQIFDYFGVPGIPVGMVNRKEFGGSRLLNYGSWGESMAQLLEQEPSVGLELAIQFNQETRFAELVVEATILKTMEGQVFVSAFLCESGLVSAQISEGVTIADYVHDDVLRAAFGTGCAWGDPLFDNGATAGQVLNKTLNLVLDHGFNEQNSHVVVVVYRGSNREVVQVEKKKLID